LNGDEENRTAHSEYSIAVSQSCIEIVVPASHLQTEKHWRYSYCC